MMQMRDFGMDQASVITFVNKMASIHELDDPHIQVSSPSLCWLWFIDE
jgi:hypothetical protein